MLSAIRLSKLVIVVIAILLFSCHSFKPKYVAGYNIKIDSTEAENIEIKKWIQPYSDTLNKDLNEIIFNSNTTWVAQRPNGNLGKFITSVIQHYCNEKNKKSLDNFPFVSMVVLNNGGFRTSLPAGNISKKNIFELMPFENELVLVELNGMQMDSLFRHILKRGGEPISGMIIESKNDVYHASVVTDSLGYNEVLKPFDSRRNYWVATNDYLQKNGDGFSMMRNAKKIITPHIKMRELVIEQLQKIKKINNEDYFSRPNILFNK